MLLSAASVWEAAIKAAAGRLDLPEPFPLRVGEATFPVVWSIAGSALFLCVLSLIQGLGAPAHD